MYQDITIWHHYSTMLTPQEFHNVYFCPRKPFIYIKLTHTLHKPNCILNLKHRNGNTHNLSAVTHNIHIQKYTHTVANRKKYNCNKSLILRENCSLFVLNIIRGFYKGSSCFEHSEVSNWKAYMWLSPFSSQMSEAGVKKDVMGCYERQKASPNLIWTFQNHWGFNLFSSVWMVKIPAIFDSLGTVLLYTRKKISLTIYFLKQLIK